MKNILLIFILLFISYPTFSQKQTAFWYFGERAGLDFNSGNPIALTDSQMETNEGCATISDYNGNLLFYTNGVTVWNRDHEIMLNGENLNGDFSSTNSAIIIPKPDNINIYYIFTVDNLGGPNGLQYTEVNMLLDSGLGGITNNKNILLETPTAEKITAVRHQNDTDWWVLAHKWNSNSFIAYRITSSGVGSQISSSIGTNVTGRTVNTTGAMKFSPDGRKVAIAHSYDNNLVELLDFDDVNGIVSNPITLTGFNGFGGVYGIEFSPDSKLLYATDTNGSIYQYNTKLATPTSIINSKIEIANTIEKLGAIQIAPNGKIYVAKENDSYLGAISSPNTIGIACNYIEDGIYLNGKKSKFGLPPFIQSFFWKEIISENMCFGSMTEFTIVEPEVSQIWNFDDPSSGINNTSSAVNPTHIFTAPGKYAVQLNSVNFLGDISTTITNITISETPVASVPNNYILCDDANDDDPYNGVVQSFLLTDKDHEILGNLDPLLYGISYFEDSNLTTSIIKSENYANSTAIKQTIYAKIYNRNDDTCFDTVQFDLIVNPSPTFDLEEDIVLCSNDLPLVISSSNAQGNYSYNWILEDGTVYSTSENLIFTTIETIPSEGLTLTLIATDPINFCNFSKDIHIEKFEVQSISPEDISITDLSDNNTVSVNSQNVDFSTYEFALDNGFGEIGTFQNEPYFENVSPGVRTLFYRDINNCGNGQIDISIVGYPNFFTPNNDGVNDTWNVLGVNEVFYASSKVNIFDRFGKLVIQIDILSDGWNGRINGNYLPSTDYWFTVELVDLNGMPRFRKGHFSLIRK